MLKFSKKSNVKNTILDEKELINSYKEYELKIKETLEKYLSEFKYASFDNESLNTMLINSFENAIMQIDNNLFNIDLLSKNIDTLYSQRTVSTKDISEYNNLFEKSSRDIELTQKFIHKTLRCFNNVDLSGKKSSISAISDCQKILLEPSPFFSEESSSFANNVKEKTIQKKIDYSTSDLLCLFPKSKDENLIISTAKDNYKLSFNGEYSKIYIESEDVTFSINAIGVQVSNSNSNSVLLVSYSDAKYTIVTNNQLEIPSFMQITKIAKNEDFLEVETICDALSLIVKNGVINFEEFQQRDVDYSTKSEISDKNNLEIEEEPIKLDSTVEALQLDTIEKAKDLKDTILIQTDEITDNDTLIISDENKKVLLPYKVSDLRKKLEKNKNYKTLKDVIDKEYTISTDNFKNPVKSRYREAYSLIRKKEHGSIKEAISLGLELMFQSDLNPAIIAACKDLDELDIYLDCLDDHELDKFNCFKILYNIPPAKNYGNI